MKKNLFLLFAFLAIVACTDDVNEVTENKPPQADFEIFDGIDEMKFVDKSTDPEDDPLTFQWSVESDLFSLSEENMSASSILLTYFSLDVEVTLKVSDALLEDSITKTISLPKLNETRRIGLGAELSGGKSNNVDYDWYFDQGNTGAFSFVNCGPSSVSMAIKWTDETFDRTPEDARNTFRPNGGWWNTNDITSYLDRFNVSNYTTFLYDIDIVKEEIDKGNIAILCLEMYYISPQKKNHWHVDKFYSANTKEWGHFIVVKGYKLVDNQILYEVYDPYNFDKTYSDGQTKGVDRYYRGGDLNEATNKWWDYAIVVTRAKSNVPKGVDTSKIIHKSGR